MYTTMINCFLLYLKRFQTGSCYITKWTTQQLVALEFEDEVMAALTVCHKLRLDFSGVSYIASTVLRTLLSVQQLIDNIDDAEMTLTGVTGEVMETFKDSGFSEILEIESGQ